ncbi:MAG: hypothetical protein IJ558_04670 [Treponema sp.]|nr:hypothetical protein [Treponema sp.]
MEKIELLSIQNLPILMGFPNLIAKEKDYPEEIYSFGIGKQTGEHTHLEFSQPLKYAGETLFEERSYDLFRIPESGIAGKDLFNADTPLYLMLELDDRFTDIWFLYRPKDRKCHTVKKVFNKYLPKKEIA